MATSRYYIQKKRDGHSIVSFYYAVYQEIYETAEEREKRIMRHYLRCSLNGGVYLLHRLESEILKDMCLCFPTPILYLEYVRRATWAYGRAGVQETVPLADSTE